jgi:hypothetical protein
VQPQVSSASSRQLFDKGGKRGVRSMTEWSVGGLGYGVEKPEELWLGVELRGPSATLRFAQDDALWAEGKVGAV